MYWGWRCWTGNGTDWRISPVFLLASNFMAPPLVMTDSSLLKMTIEIVDFPIKNGDVPLVFGMFTIEIVDFPSKWWIFPSVLNVKTSRVSPHPGHCHVGQCCSTYGCISKGYWRFDSAHGASPWAQKKSCAAQKALFVVENRGNVSALWRFMVDIYINILYIYIYIHK